MIFDEVRRLQIQSKGIAPAPPLYVPLVIKANLYCCPGARSTGTVTGAAAALSAGIAIPSNMAKAPTIAHFRKPRPRRGGGVSNGGHRSVYHRSYPLITCSNVEE